MNKRNYIFSFLFLFNRKRARSGDAWRKKKKMEQDDLNVEHRAAVLGAPGVGKSMIKWHLLYQRFVEDYDPVIEEAVRRQMTVDDATCTLDLLETNSHEHAGYDSPLALYLTALPFG
jgi:hypothetical protein